MRAGVLTMLAAAMATAALPVWAGELAATDSHAIEQTIRGQMEAFARDDAAGAFAFASPGTQQRFADAEMFLDMVRRGYQPVYHPHGVDFTALGTEDGRVVQSVEIIGPDGGAYTALYTMQQEPDGTWRIVACMLLPSRRVGA